MHSQGTKNGEMQRNALDSDSRDERFISGPFDANRFSGELVRSASRDRPKSSEGILEESKPEMESNLKWRDLAFCLFLLLLRATRCSGVIGSSAADLCAHVLQ